MIAGLTYLIPSVILFLAIWIPVFWIERWRDFNERKKRSPLTTQLLRSPGESLRRELDDLNIDIALFLALTPGMVLTVYGAHISGSYLGGTPETASRLVVSVILGSVAFGFGLYKIISLARRRVKLRLGYMGELAVAQELNHLMRQGAAVYHDIPGDGFNIDHVLVGPKGIYAIETKARTKPKRDKGKEDAKVVFDGKTLNFPTWKETEPLEQAARQAKWLAKWLSSATGESCDVKGAIALPGWYVERTGRADVAVFNPKSTQFLLDGWFNEPMTESKMQRIIHQLDQRCRDVEPELYRRKSQKQ